jgi:hypothetical protein
MPGIARDRTIHYGEQAEQFHPLAKMEKQPRAHARLLELAAQYRQLADTKPRKPNGGSLSTRARNE